MLMSLTESLVLTLNYCLAFFNVSIVCKLCFFEAYSVHCPLCWVEGGGVKPSIKFLKRGFAGKEKVVFFRGSCGLYIENKLKYNLEFKLGKFNQQFSYF